MTMPALALVANLASDCAAAGAPALSRAAMSLCVPATSTKPVPASARAIQSAAIAPSGSSEASPVRLANDALWRDVCPPRRAVQFRAVALPYQRSDGEQGGDANNGTDEHLAARHGAAGDPAGWRALDSPQQFVRRRWPCSGILGEALHDEGGEQMRHRRIDGRQCRWRFGEVRRHKLLRCRLPGE